MAPEPEDEPPSASATLPRTAADASTDAPGSDVPRSTARPRGRRPGLVALFPRSEDEATPVWLVSDAMTTLGRARDAGIRPEDRRTSRKHAELAARTGGLFIRDLASRHGSFVDGVRVRAEGLLASFGSVVRFGDTVYRVVEDVERYRSPPVRLAGSVLGLPHDLVAGPVLAEIWAQATRMARLSDPVLILGETGTGKEGIARILHARGSSQGAFVGLNVAAVPEALFEAELFGHEKGAFTGATVARPGAFREAADGLLFLDEIGDLQLGLQAKLLRALDLRRVRPLGASRDVPVTTRVASATNRDLRAASETGAFRSDLLYRLSGLVIRVPPLRERPEDVILLALQALRRQGAHLRLSADAAQALAMGPWAGNVRQLQNVLGGAIEQALADGAEEIRPEHLSNLGEPGNLEGDELTAKRVQLAMLRANGVASRAAELLGVSRMTLYNTFKRLEINVDSLRGRAVGRRSRDR